MYFGPKPFSALQTNSGILKEDEKDSVFYSTAPGKSN